MTSSAPSFDARQWDERRHASHTTATYDPTSATVTFQVNNAFAGDSDIYIRHEVYDETFLSKTCATVPAAAPCQEPTANTVTAACRDDKFALVYVYYATTDASVLPFEDATIHQCCHPDDYDSATTGVVEMIYKIDCACPTAAIGRRMLRGTSP